MPDVFAEMKSTPYWWEAAPRVDDEPVDLPASVDTLIVGGGFGGHRKYLMDK